MKKQLRASLLAASFLFGMSNGAFANGSEQGVGSDGITPSGPFTTPSGAEQHGVTITSSSALPSIPAGTLYATVCAKTASVSYSLDALTTPTSSVGFTLATGSCVGVAGPVLISNSRWISATGTLDVGYYK
jgi:hypothetical protein